MNQGLSAAPKKGTVGAGSVATTRTNRERLDGRTGVPTTRCRASTPALSRELRAPATVAARGRTKAYAMRFPLLSCESLTCLLHDSARAAAVVGAWNGRPAGRMESNRRILSIWRPKSPLFCKKSPEIALLGSFQCPKATPPSRWLAARAATDGGQDMSIAPGWVSVSDAARYVKLAPDVITRAIASGDLPAVIKPVTRRDGGRPQYRVALADVDTWMRSQPSAKEAMCGV